MYIIFTWRSRKEIVCPEDETTPTAAISNHYHTEHLQKKQQQH